MTTTTAAERPAIEEDPQELSLRPTRLSEYINQEQVKANLGIAMQAARARGEMLDHTLFYGPPGLGKSSLAMIIANEMGVNLKITSGPAIEGAREMAALLSTLARDRVGVLFIDEVHRLPHAVEEVLYPAMEDGAFDIVLGKGADSRSLRIKLPRFTFIGATTRAGLISPPLKDRFGLTYRLEYHGVPALQQIVRRSAGILGVSIDDGATGEIARRARGTPRVANTLLRRARDYAQVKGRGHISQPIAAEALTQLGIDDKGLDQTDQMLLRALCEKFAGGPVGLSTLASSISEDERTVMDSVEPFLLKLGFLTRTPRGRTATRAAYEHLRLPWNSALDMAKGGL